jgi:hypothetical protein
VDPDKDVVANCLLKATYDKLRLSHFLSEVEVSGPQWPRADARLVSIPDPT